MSQHFKPDPYQIAYKRHTDNEPRATEKEPPYRILWWRRTKPYEKTALFYISFQAEAETDKVEEALAKQFGDALKKVCRWGFWYEVQLNTLFEWGDVIGWTDKALEGLV